MRPVILCLAPVLMLGLAGTASHAAPAPAGVAVKAETKAYTFEYSYPAAAAAIPALKARLDRAAAKARAELADLTKPEPGAPADPRELSYDHTTNWSVVTNLPGWLSLSAQHYEFTGGAHGMVWFSGLLWDKAANRERAVTDLFTSKAALKAAIGAPFCAALDRERAKRREAPVNRASGDMFDACIDPLEEVLILGSADRQRFTRIGVLVAPYSAGPWAEGAYEVTLPVTPAVLRAVKPQFRAAFAAGR